jgi:hypothetical protein
LAELENITTHLSVSLVKSEMRENAGVDAATLDNNWGIGIEAAKSTRLLTNQRGIRRMIHPSLKKRYKKNDRQLQYRRLPVKKSLTQCTQQLPQSKRTRQLIYCVLILAL